MADVSEKQEIEITLEMIEAGAQYIQDMASDGLSWNAATDLARHLYLKMEEVRSA